MPTVIIRLPYTDEGMQLAQVLERQIPQMMPQAQVEVSMAQGPAPSFQPPPRKPLG